VLGRKEDSVTCSASKKRAKRRSGSNQGHSKVEIRINRGKRALQEYLGQREGVCAKYHDVISSMV